MKVQIVCIAIVLIKCQMIVSICFQFNRGSYAFILDETIVQLLFQKWIDTPCTLNAPCTKQKNEQMRMKRKNG